jgi:hypothetical protein
MLATAVDGSQSGQSFTVTYTDNSTTVFTQSLSDWTSPQNYPGETVVAATAYRDTGNGSTDPLTRVFVYGYSFSLNNNKTVRSIKLPNNGDLLVLAITLANDFAFYASPTSFILTAGGKAASYLTTEPVNGFSGNVSLSASALPAGVTASFNPPAPSATSILTLSAGATAPPSNTTLYVTGTLSGVTHYMTFNLADITPIPAAAEVNLSSVYNVSGILTSAPSWGGCLFSLGPANEPDAVGCAGQTITLPAGQYTGLLLLATAVNTSQPNQVFQIAYTDGSTVNMTQSISVWTASQNYSGESVAIAAAYSDTSGGTENTGAPVNVNGYLLGLNDSKTVQSIALPNNANVIILAMTLAEAPTAVSLALKFNRAGIYADGTSFSGGADGGGYAYSSNQLGPSQIWDSVQFKFGPANANDMIACEGQIVSLPANRYTTLLMLAAGVQGNQTSQSFTVTYTDKSTETIVQSFSDWVNVTAYTNQFIAVTMPYRDAGSGLDASTTHIYGYLFPLNNTKTVQSLTLPDNSDVDILAVTLANTPLPVSLQTYNRAGIYTDGTQFTTGGLDNDGNAYSATLLGPAQTWHNSLFAFGLPNQTNVISASGQVITLPQGQYSSLLMLATAVNGSQSSQLFTVHYANGTSTSYSQSVSDWAQPQNYAGESVVVAMPYRDSGGGSQVGPAVDLYGYSFALNGNNVFQSITLPNNNNVEILAITLSNYTAVLPEAPAITSEPQSLTVTNGNPAAFSVTAIGTHPLSYQWETNGVSLAGATGSALDIGSTTTNDAATYTVVINNPYGAVTSSPAVLIVGVPPAISSGPLPLTVTNGSPAAFSVMASGTPPLGYQWQMDGTNTIDGGEISGSAASTLTLSATETANSGSYDVIVANSFGSVTSSVVTLNVVFVFQSAAQGNGAINFSWTTTPGVSYQVQYTTDLSTSNWINLGTAILATNGETSASDILGPDPQRFYRVIQQ